MAATLTIIIAFSAAITLVVLVATPGLVAPASATRPRKLVLRYYAHQQFGVDEFNNVPSAVPPINGTLQGVGLQVVYNYDISDGPNATTSSPLGFIRGTSTVALNSVNGTVFVANAVVHYDNLFGLRGTFTTQGEANFVSGNPWEYAVTGGTGDFRNAFGYAVGRTFSFVPPTANSTAKITTVYKTHLWLRHV